MAFRLWALAFGLFASSAQATTFLLKTDEQKMVEADWICAVSVSKVLGPNDTPPPAASKLNHRFPLTYAAVKPIECFKGGTSQEFFVYWPGGTRIETRDGRPAQIRTIVPGTPNLVPNQTAVLYLMKSSSDDSLFSIHSLVNGVSDLEWDNKDKQYVFKNASRVDDKKNVKFATTDFRTLKGFKSRVQQVLRSAK